MKKAKLIMAASMLTLGAFSVTLFTSCSKDKECEIGYEGDDCKTLMRDKFVGDWSGKDICTSGEYDIEISATRSTTNDLNVLVSNPGGFGGTIRITGTVINSTTLEFTNQDVGEDRILNGKMTITASGNDLSFSYTVEGDVDEDSCSGNYTRQ